MHLYDFGLVAWPDSQVIFALAHLGREGLALLEPASPAVCVGYHQDASAELDLAFIQSRGIPVMRSQVGGGTIFLDRGQLIYGLVLRKDNPAVPAGKQAFCRKFLQPLIDTLASYGVTAAFRPVNNVLVRERKISGVGVAEIGDCLLLLGNVLVDFDPELMSRVLRVPDEKFRDKVYKTICENLTTLPQECGCRPAIDEIGARLAERHAGLLGPLAPHDYDGELHAKAAELHALFSRREWIFYNELRGQVSHEIKITADVSLIHKMVKLPGGLVCASAVVKHGCLRDVHLSGDFFFYPSPRLVELELELDGVEQQPDALANTVQRFYQQYRVESPGISPLDIAAVLEQ